MIYCAQWARDGKLGVAPIFDGCRDKGTEDDMRISCYPPTEGYQSMEPDSHALDK